MAETDRYVWIMASQGDDRDQVNAIAALGFERVEIEKRVPGIKLRGNGGMIEITAVHYRAMLQVTDISLGRSMRNAVCLSGGEGVAFIVGQRGEIDIRTLNGEPACFFIAKRPHEGF
ncbi:hypothetical protein A2973_04590 [Candidatus Gottesmanbacteria bacterium RIFCSPLOWO2_01_FULL_49_10]|uniref:Uncharacterized protein n=1 Tax=Candidatus Gottesmanbacteria bacterium RIFCSPLOWO2_01_FULL_49_10 TaxID=1798396 RepID=A0A1F6B038_9BACT|nr:MAG: hypothetical protein A2973_04590 [Candidatus Gottesmanbacteria bacterium RIFCSPLOWO2_01_FULL_49_10]